MSLRLPVILTVCAGLIAAGCSSDSQPGGDTTAAGSSTSSIVVASSGAPTTSIAASTTTADSSGPTSSAGGGSATTDGDEADATTTTMPPVPTYPLTGTPILDPVAAQRPAMVVKIDNFPGARPQSGLNEADIVFEENVEQLTRFAAIFHSNGAEPVGPIRSGRTQDIDLLGSYNKPLFIWSGGNGRVTAAINASDLVPVNETKAGDAMFRDRTKRGPHNLFGHMDLLYAFAPPDAGPPPPQFEYRGPDDAVQGEAADGVKVSMDNVKVLWQWVPELGLYVRFSDNKPHGDSLTGNQVATNNVVVLYVQYKPSPADGRSPEAQTEGFGVAWVFTAGKWVQGAWTRADRLEPFTLTDLKGKPILLSPGHTFVELSRQSKGAVIPPGADPTTVKFP
jgi:hypothetical protein